MWVKVAEDKEVISYKKKMRDRTVIIEARFEGDFWHVYKTQQMKGSSKIVHEYKAEDREEVMHLISRLKKEKRTTADSKPISSSTRSVKIHIHRSYKEYDVEKWLFSINNDIRLNAAIIRYADEIVIDLLIHESFRDIERLILKRLFKMLNLDEFSSSIQQNIYFFSDEKHSQRQGPKGIIVNDVEIGFEE